MSGARWAALGAFLVLVAADGGAAEAGATDGAVVVDDFERIDRWSAHPADGVQLDLGSDAGFVGHAMRLDFRFSGGGYAIARREVDLDLPANWEFSFRIRGEAPPNDLEFKLIDASGENVWWSVRRDVRFPRDWERYVVKKRQVSFAWGPRGGGEIRHVAAIELAITARSGGAGSVWIDELALRELPPPGELPARPGVRASSSAPGSAAELAVDGDPGTAWAPDPADPDAWLALDLGGRRELGGLVIDWAPGRAAADYRVEIDDDEGDWRVVRSVTGGNGGRDPLFLPESEGRRIRVRLGGAAPGSAAAPAPAIAGIALRPLPWSATREVFFEDLARNARRGLYPRAIAGEQSYWTIVGVDADPREVLFDEDARLETGPQMCSVEPFLRAGETLATWADAPAVLSLEDDCLPIPTVTRRFADLELAVTAFPTGEPGRSGVVARYRVTNRGAAAAVPTLFLALRPFQVNPPAQFLNHPGGVAPVGAIARDGRTVRVDGRVAVVSLTPPAAFGATTFDGGDVVADHLAHGRLPDAQSVEDPFGAASAALAYPLELAPGATAEVAILVPLHAATGLPAVAPNGVAAAAWTEERFTRSRETWRDLTGGFTLQLPPAAPPLEKVVRSQIAWILVNRAGPRIQPGARAYARSWIRDGSLTSTALLRLGRTDPAREFLEWFAPFQFANGKVPCVVDERGADPVPEHDSSGELVYLVGEVWRATRDRDLLERMWPHVLAAADYLDSLRQERRTEEWRTPGNAPFFGILPPSISHEGYSSKPMHSYWDDFFAWRGFDDATALAVALGRYEDAARLGAIRREFRTDLAASVEAARAMHGIDYVPGCADLGDFDATSTTIALDPTRAASFLPAEALIATFRRYRDFFDDRRDGAPWEAFTPYEIRNVGAFVRLGWREPANELLDFFLAYRRPVAWNQWPEVVWHDERAPHFLGDLPHGWVGSDFIRSALDLFVHEGVDGRTLVLGAGIRAAWLEGPEPVVVRGIRTPYGPVGYTMVRTDDGLEVRIEGGLEIPPGGLLVDPPGAASLPDVRVDGRPASRDAAGRVVVRSLPAVVLWRR